MNWHWKLHIFLALVIVGLTYLLTHAWGKIEAIKEMQQDTQAWASEIHAQAAAVEATAREKAREAERAALTAKDVWKDISKLPSRAVQRAFVRWAKIKRKEEAQLAATPPENQSTAVGGPD